MAASSSSSSSSLPIAMIFYPLEKDKAFDLDHPDTVKRIEHLSRKYHVITHEISSIKQAFDKASTTFKKERECAIMEFAGHGSSRSIVFSKGTPQGTLSVTNNTMIQLHFHKLISYVKPNGIIITQSCENGVKIDGKTNILQWITSFTTPGQRVYGTSATLNDFLLSHNRHIQYIHRKTGEDVTRIYQKTIKGTIQEIPSRQLQVLCDLLGGKQENLDLSSKLLAEIENPSERQKLLAKHPEVPESIIRYFKGLTFKKNDFEGGDSSWLDILESLESLTSTVDWGGDATIALTPACRAFKVKGDDAIIIGPDRSKEKLYSSVYRFILALAAMEKYSSLINILDNGKGYFANPAAQAIYALTGHTLHSQLISPKQLLLGLGNIPSVTKKSYALAKEKKRLHRWFEKAFIGVCLDQRCDSLQSYYSKQIRHPTKRVQREEAVVLSETDTPSELVAKLAKPYKKYLLNQLKFTEEPKRTYDHNYLEFYLQMTERYFTNYIVNLLKIQGIEVGANEKGREQNQKWFAELSTAIEGIGWFLSKQDIIEIISQTKSCNIDEVIKLAIKKTKFTKDELAGVLARAVPKKISYHLPTLYFEIDEAIQFCVKHQLNCIDLSKYGNMIEDKHIVDLIKAHSTFKKLTIKSNTITDLSIDEIVKSCTHLTFLNIFLCDKVTADAIATIPKRVTILLDES